ncbi:hypothetical protein Gogos_013403, partial [Gossypium gossypioides]|nr:hypothetical protein [Gossypium gossypioides]
GVTAGSEIAVSYSSRTTKAWCGAKEIVKVSHSWANQCIATFKGGIAVRPTSRAEMGILDGVVLAQGKQHNRVLVQADNMRVIESVNESLLKGSNSPLIRLILQHLQNKEVWSIKYVPIDENLEVDSITKLA